MGDFDLVIRNGTVATAGDVARCDVGIRGGRIVALGEALGTGAEDIDATGRLVLPGGIDAHCHIDQHSSFGVRSADDFRSGTTSAACGGTTTIIPFAAQQRGESLRQVVADYHARAKDRALIDYAFHLIISDPNEHVLGQELPALIRDGYTSFKIFMTYDALRLGDRQILDVLALARREGALTMIHAENHDCCAWLSERLIAAGNTQPHYHGHARPMAVEREATHRAITLAEIADVPILIVHVSGAEAADQIEWARQRGLRVFAETCPQYLFLAQADMERPGFEGAKFICSPPPRPSDNQARIWRGLDSGLFDLFSSDHAPYRYDDPAGKMHHGKGAPFTKVPNGVPGLEVRLPLLFSAGVREGRLSLQTFVAVTATNAARLYGLYPRKGTIAVGSDADIAIWDTERTVTIRHERLHDAMDYTPYEGTTVTGWPVLVLSRGEVVSRDGEPMSQPGRGQFLPCATPEPLRPRSAGWLRASRHSGTGTG